MFDATRHSANKSYDAHLTESALLNQRYLEDSAKQVTGTEWTIRSSRLERT